MALFLLINCLLFNLLLHFIYALHLIMNNVVTRNRIMETSLRKVTIIFYSDISLELMHEVACCHQNKNGRVVISDEFKKDKSIIAVCDGEVNILNKIGDRVHMDDIAEN